MIYLRTSIGVEIRREDLLITCLQSNFTAGVFTHVKRIADYISRDRAEVRREIDLFFKSKRLKRDGIVLGIPRQDVVIRYLDLPAEVADNLRQVILYQVQAFEPTEEEKYYHDFALLPSSPGAKRLSVLLVMIKKSLMDAHLATLRELGLKPISVTTGSAALANLFLRAGKKMEHTNRTFILADLSAAGSEITALRDGSLLYSREDKKPQGKEWRDLLVGEVEAAAARIRLGPEDTIERIILSGEEAEAAQHDVHEVLPDCALIGSHIQFEMPVENRPYLQQAAVSLGLAYSGITRRPPVKLNLLPQELRLRQTRWAYVPAVILGLALIALLSGLGLRQVIQQRILIRKLDAEILAIKDRVARVQAVRAESEAMESKLRYVEGALRQHDLNLEILQELTTILPQDTFLNVYMNQRGSVQLSGSSANAPDLIPKLERSPLLQSVVQRGTVFKDAQTGKDRFNFDAKVERHP